MVAGQLLLLRILHCSHLNHQHHYNPARNEKGTPTLFYFIWFYLITGADY